MTNITFPGGPDFAERASYINWRTQWRRAYRKLSQQIRVTKHEIKSAQRRGEHHRISTLQYQLAESKALAQGQMAIRHASKIHAGRLSAATASGTREAA